MTRTTTALRNIPLSAAGSACHADLVVARPEFHGTGATVGSRNCWDAEHPPESDSHDSAEGEGGEANDPPANAHALTLACAFAGYTTNTVPALSDPEV
jgi:hypothetical protein